MTQGNELLGRLRLAPGIITSRRQPVAPVAGRAGAIVCVDIDYSVDWPSRFLLMVALGRCDGLLMLSYLRAYGNRGWAPGGLDSTWVGLFADG